MKIIQQEIRTPRTARYCTAGDIKNANALWFVLHGHSQLARDFIGQFDYLAEPGSAVIAPEALSRAYYGSRIGASWMTKEDRENEITDYVEYLNNLLEKILSESKQGAEINIIGYSQGAHTAVRWFTGCKHKVERLFVCSSDFPRDADFSTLKQKLADAKMYYTCGDEDEFIPMEWFDAAVMHLNESGIAIEPVRFKGRHVVNHELIKNILK